MRIALSCGDPAGIGPRVALQAASRLGPDVEVALFSDARLLARLADAMGVRLGGRITCVDVGAVSPECIGMHAASAEGGRHQLQALSSATDGVMAGDFDALVTAPISKEAITLATGSHFSGHTEYLAKRAGLTADAVTMLFLGPTLRVGLVTTHVGIERLPSEITSERVTRTVLHLEEALIALGRQPPLGLWVTGLNPHAGENGLFGREEMDVVSPCLDAIRQRSDALQLHGPHPAESVFRRAQRGETDGVIAMFHDQATIASKLLDWGHAVNVTWGLPFIRTSVDHGVAYDAAALGKGDCDGMEAALQLTMTLCAHRKKI